MENVSTITIPAAGVRKKVQMKGRSVQVIQCGLYDSFKDVPKMAFNGSAPKLPLFPIFKKEYSDSGQDMFDFITIQGTEQSAGDELILMTVSECIGTEMKVQFRGEYRSTLKATFTKAASDAVQSFSEVELVNSEGNLPSAINVAVRGGATAGINYAFDADPSQGLGATDGYYLDTDPGNTPTTQDDKRIEGINYILAFRFIAAVNTETPNLIVTCEY